MRTKLLLPAVALPALLFTALPAHAAVVACRINHGTGSPVQVNRWTFTDDAATSVTGTWKWEIQNRNQTCNPPGGSQLNSLTVTGVYTGNPCSVAQLDGGATGVIYGGKHGVTHAGPGTGYVAIDSTHVFDFGLFCDPLLNLDHSATAVTVQTIVT